MQLPIAIIDAFTDQIFCGNPAATAIVAEFPEDRIMQYIAAEMNLSETAFVKFLAPNHFHLRWFTPMQEVPLCGHATLAIAHDLRESGMIDPLLPLIFSTLSGDLQISFEQESDQERGKELIVMDFPAAVYHPCPARSRRILTEMLVTKPYECLGQSIGYITVLLESEAAVQQFQPQLGNIADLDALGLVITAIADTNRPYDFVSRFFAPKVGIPEDPVTGSAHCSLTPYWSKRLGKRDLIAKQLSKRTGILQVGDRGDRVLLKGTAKTFLRGQISV